MKKVLNPQIEAGSRASNEPRLLGSIVKEMLHGNSPLAVGYRQYIASRENTEAVSWKPNTHLCVDLKTFLRSDRCAKPNREYLGWLKRDKEDHFIFVESLPQPVGKRNPHVFKGRFITVTRRDDGSFQPNFRPMPKGKGFSLERYAQGVYNELCIALGGLIEEE